jgi:hypothetical protein
VFIIIYATLGMLFGEPELCATTRRESAKHDEANAMVEHRVVKTESGIVSRQKNSLSMASRWARRLEALPKTCHLLPSTAILEPQDR